MQVVHLQSTEKCKNCVNFLEHYKNKIECDYDMFEKTEKKKALLFMPTMFKCKHYEDMRDM